MKKLLFVHSSKYDVMDGLYGALLEMEKDFEIERYNLNDYAYPMDKLKQKDFVLGWGAFGSPVDKFLQPIHVKKGLCIAGNTFAPDGADNYDILFYETKWARNYLNLHTHPRIVQAFGVNTDVYFEHPMGRMVVWDFLGVGAFASWKRWEKMKDKWGRRMVVGEYQVGNEKESLGIVSDLIRNGIGVSPMMKPFDLSNLYNWTKTVYIPSDVNGGGERAVLEGLACGCTVEIEPDNPKLRELLELEKIPSHIDYANKLTEGILSIL